MADQILLTPSRVFDASGTSGAGYKAYFYLPGTMTAATVYSDSDLTVPHTSPLVADSTGRFAQVFAAPGGVKVIVTDADDVAQFTLDPAFRASASGAGASEVTFEPGAIPEDNVQDAIEWVFANAASATIGSGIGVTGSATLLADLDATGTASGVYRFDNTTTGTYPTGAPAVDTGHVAIWRETASSASMTLYHDASDRVFYRRMESTAWGTWREFVVVNQGAAEGDILYRTATAWTRLAKGTAGQALQMNSGATAPEWVTPFWPGVGQTWQNVLASRTHSTSYQNSTTRPIFVALNGDNGRNVEVSPDNSNWFAVGVLSNTSSNGVQFVVPVGHYYRVNGSSTLSFWTELR